jgi:EAL domain-containing protein (putative c-di-GMP-specific phosphodiesterase class I)
VVEAVRTNCAARSTFSGGVGDARPGDTASLLIYRARSALYEAKQNGRDRVCVAFHDDTILGELADGIQAGQLVVHYQPIVALPATNIVGAEALVRWSHATRGLVGPDEFIPVAERGGLIRRLGATVLSTACREATAWPDDLKLTVKVSGFELADPGYASSVLDILEDSGFDPGRLVIEVTESLLEAESSDALANLVQLRRCGVRVALDDFGTGYSSLARLDRLPIDIVKIDRSFVERITADVSDSAVIAAVCALCQTLGLTIVAEGIEDTHQAAVLTGYGCQQGQGYLFSRPVPAELLSKRFLPVKLYEGGA